MRSWTTLLTASSNAGLALSLGPSAPLTLIALRLMDPNGVGCAWVPARAPSRYSQRSGQQSFARWLFKKKTLLHTPV